MLPQASCADRVKPTERPRDPPPVLLVDFQPSSGFATVWLGRGLLCFLPVVCCAGPLVWSQPPNGLDTITSAVFHTPPTLWPGEEDRWLNDVPAGQHPAWISLLDSGSDSLTDSCSTDIPQISGPMLDAYQRDRQVTKWLIKAVKRQENEVASFPVRSLRLLAGTCMPPLWWEVSWRRLPWWLSGKEWWLNAGDEASAPGSGRDSGGGNDKSLQHSCWETPWTEEPGGSPRGLQNSRTQLCDETTTTTVEDLRKEYHWDQKRDKDKLQTLNSSSALDLAHLHHYFRV